MHSPHKTIDNLQKIQFSMLLSCTVFAPLECWLKLKKIVVFFHLSALKCPYLNSFQTCRLAAVLDLPTLLLLVTFLREAHSGDLKCLA